MTRQEDIVLSLIQTTEGRDFAAQNGWDVNSGSSTNVCAWFGISCNTDGEVTSISLTGHALEATLPSTLSQLPALQTLILASCGLGGTIPYAVAQLSNLRVLDLSLNNLTGPIPLVTSTKLTILSLSHNKLSGPLPALDTVEMPSLGTIDVKHNQLTGTVPAFPDHFSSLRHVDLSQNKLHGPLESLATYQLPSLRRLFLADNSFSGTLPSALGDSLQEVHLQSNHLTGTIPAALAAMAGLEVLLVHNNRLTGDVPPEICELQLNREYSASTSTGNGAGDDDNGISRHRRLDTNLVISDRDGCAAVACPAGFYSPTGYSPCSPCEDQLMNPYLGAIKCLSFSQEQVLDTLYNATSEYGWTDQSWGDNAVPVCSRKGVDCNGQGNVIGLNLKNQGLSGTIPLELGFLPNLIALDLSHNSLTGQLPEELALAPIRTLVLSENNLSGYVPDSLCRKKGINGNGYNDEYSCDYIACPMGTYHPEGHATPDRPCQPCPMIDGLVLANTNCGSTAFRGSTLSESSEDRIPDWSQIVIMSLVGAVLILLGYMALQKLTATPRQQKLSNTDTTHVSSLQTPKEKASHKDLSVDLKASTSDLSLQSIS